MLNSRHRNNYSSSRSSHDVTPSVRVTVYGVDGNSDTYITNKTSLNPIRVFEKISSNFIDLNDTTEVNRKGFYKINENPNPNPTLTVVEGETYTFNVKALGHPFWIKTVKSTGTENAYSSGVTNNGIADGTITFTVPYDAPSILYYNCQLHSSMAGEIIVIDVPVPPPVSVIDVTISTLSPTAPASSLPVSPPIAFILTPPPAPPPPPPASPPPPPASPPPPPAPPPPPPPPPPIGGGGYGYGY